MEKYSACDMADVAIILSSLFTSGSWGSTARSRDSASSLLDLRKEKQKVNSKFSAGPDFSCDKTEERAPEVQGGAHGGAHSGAHGGAHAGAHGGAQPHPVLMEKPPATALSTSWLKNSWRGGGWRLSRA